MLPSAALAKAGLHLERLARFDERMDLLWQSARAGYDAIVVRDRAYMNWRYADSPLPYLRVGALRGDRLIGVAVGRVDASADGAPIMNVADLLTDRDDRGWIGYVLVGHLLQAAHRRGCVVAQADRSEASAARGRNPIHTALRAHGFGFKRVVGTTIVRTFTGEPDVRALVEQGGWAYQSGDSDQG